MAAPVANMPRWHYGFAIVITVALVVGCCLGLARFAFGVQLPAMRDGLGFDYAAGGVLGSTYFVGYLVTVFALPRLIARIGARGMILAGLALLTAGMTAMGFSGRYDLLLVFYLITGIGAGMAFIPAMSLASTWFLPSHRGAAAGLMLAGAGAGILLSGLVVPALEPLAGRQDWQVGWISFAILSLATLAVGAIVLSNRPADRALEPYGMPAQATRVDPGSKPRSVRLVLAHLGAIYACYGFTYMIYTTFIVTTMVDERGLSAGSAGLVWSVVGFTSMASGALFGALSDRIGRRGGLMAASALQALSFALVAGPFGTPALMASVVCFGLSAWSIPTIMAAAAGDYLGPERAAAGLAAVTLIFAIGQALGPVVGGALAEWWGGFGPGFGLCAVLALGAIALSGLLRNPGA